MIYKISFVVPGRRKAGGIENSEVAPHPGERWQVGKQLLEIVEVIELLPPRGDFTYLHATCRLAKKSAE
jgi:hypothetical protein